MQHEYEYEYVEFELLVLFHHLKEIILSNLGKQCCKLMILLRIIDKKMLPLRKDQPHHNIIMSSDPEDDVSTTSNFIYSLYNGLFVGNNEVQKNNNGLVGTRGKASPTRTPRNTTQSIFFGFPDLVTQKHTIIIFLLQIQT